MDSRINVLCRLGSPREKLSHQLQCSVFINVSSVNTKKVQSSHQSSCPLPRVLLLEFPGANICRDRRFVTRTHRAPLLLLWWFFSLSKAGVRGLAPPPVLHGLWVSGGAPPALRNRPAALRRLAGPPPLRLWLAGGAPPLSAFLPCFLPLGLVVGWAGAFPFLLVRGGAVACLLLLRWRWAIVIPRADLYHQRGRLQKAPRGLGVVWVEPLGFAVSWRDAFLTPDPVWGDGIGISRQHGLLIKLPGADVRLERERWPGWPRFPRFLSVLPLSSFIFGASSVGRRLACSLPLLGAAPFADSRAAAAASPAAGSFSRSDGNMFLGLSLRRSLRFFQLPGTNLGHIVEVPAGFGANGRLASTYLFKSIGTKTANQLLY